MQLKKKQKTKPNVIIYVPPIFGSLSAYTRACARARTHTHTRARIYIYLLSSTDRFVSFYQNSSVWLDSISP